VVHWDALSETWTSNARPYAASQVRATRQTCWDDPRSTCSHCGSLNALDQRVPALPSTAADADVPAFSAEDATAGRFSAALSVPQSAACAAVTGVRASAKPNSDVAMASARRGRVGRELMFLPDG
jgi:hypothetical protein